MQAGLLRAEENGHRGNLFGGDEPFDGVGVGDAPLRLFYGRAIALSVHAETVNQGLGLADGGVYGR